MTWGDGFRGLLCVYRGGGGNWGEGGDEVDRVSAGGDVVSTP